MSGNPSPSSEFVATHYPSDLTDSQWDLVSSFFPQGPNSGNYKRSLVNVVLHLVCNDCKWRALPHDFTPWPTVSSFYRRARLCGYHTHTLIRRCA